MLTYQKLFNKPGKLVRFTGLTPFQFKTLAKRLKPLWIKSETERLTRDNRMRAIGAGRKYKLRSIEDKLLLILIFYRIYLNYEVLGWIFNLDASNICRMIKRLFPLVEKAADPTLRFALKSVKHKCRRLNFEEFAKEYPDMLEFIIDSTEQKRQRPKNKKKQKNFYSGKKHQHGLKTQIVVNKKGKIVNVSRTYPARIHDKTVILKEKTINKIPFNIKIFLDKGYVGVNKVYPHSKINIPIKANRWKRKLSRSEKIKNTKQAKKRVIVEHIIASLKKYQILSQVYRSNDNDYNIHFRNIASLYNFRLVFKQLESN